MQILRKKVITEIALIVCTRNRHDYINNFLQSLENLSTFPSLIIFVDSSDNSETHNLIKSAENRLLSKIHYLKSGPGLPFQRNVGIDFLLSIRDFDNIEIVSFTDDDCTLSVNYFDEIFKSFGSLPECVGVTGIMTPANIPMSTWLHKVFGIRSDKAGKILKSGITTSSAGATSTANVDWMPGGSMNIAIGVFASLRFDSNLRMYGEDLKMSLGLASYGQMYVIPEARVTHWEAQSGKDQLFKVVLHTDAIRWQLSKEFPKKIKKKWVLLSIIGECIICCANIARHQRVRYQFETIKAHITFLAGLSANKQNLQLNNTYSQ